MATDQDLRLWTAAHRKLRRLVGPASQYSCVDCGEQAADWSYRYRTGQRYAHSADPADYEPRCRPCHGRHDAKPVTVIDRAVGATIRHTRERQGITQAAMARHIGRSSGHLSSVEAGRRRLEPASLAKVCSALGISGLGYSESVFTDPCA
ncbi:helix-turn-helix domain-containing protein [Mycobacterium sp. G7A2]|uniref:helix-turn-helix domain-containing protein n=1 Tax=Mycobacterium sp. G7A2 TaxID=3317307 RepID=UPI0035A901DA